MFSLATALGIAGGGFFMLGDGLFNKVAFANDLTYQTQVPVEFTFDDYLNVTVSGDLVISDLAPGTFADSNHIVVTVNTNNAYGYTLSATVGDTNNASRDLRHSGYGTGGNTEVFSNLDLDANLTRETFSTGSTYDNKWGFSTDKAGSSYSGKYNGLPLYTNTEDTVVLDTSNYMPTDGTSTTNFWIGAKASNDRIAGTYVNVVNFVAVGGVEVIPEPTALYMQDVATWGSSLSTGDEITVVDSRDGKEYTVAKLADGNIWMTQNLDFDIVDGGVNLNSTNTDVPNDWADAGNLTDTYATDDTTWDEEYTNQPESYDPGDLCWNGTLDNDWSTTLDDGTVACGDDKHYHIGNYYNWTAAVAMSDSSSYQDDGVDVDQSVCPAGWRLPNYDGAKDYSNLASTLSLTSGDGGNIYEEPVYFFYGGGWYGSSDYVGTGGFYWSSVVDNGNSAYHLYFDANSNLYPQGYDGRSLGASVRCVAR